MEASLRLILALKRLSSDSQGLQPTAGLAFCFKSFSVICLSLENGPN
jgi:hypothetical protein